MTEVAFGWERPTVSVEVPDDEVATYVRGLFPTLVLDGVTGVDRPIRMSRRGSGLHIVDVDRRSSADSLPEALATLELAIARRLLGSRSTYVHAHAAGAVVNGASVVMFGPSGAGKSNLAMAFHRSGYPLLGDDIVLLGAEGTASAFPRLLKLDEDRALAHGVDLDETLGRDPDEPEVWIDPTRGAGWATGAAPVRLLARVKWQEGASVELLPIRPAQAINALVHGLLDTGLPAARAVDHLVDLVRRAVTVECVFGDAVEAAAALARAVDPTEARGAP